jgi:hypothetical protein
MAAAHVREVAAMKSEWSGVAAFALIVAWICWVLWFLITHYMPCGML